MAANERRAIHSLHRASTGLQAFQLPFFAPYFATAAANLGHVFAIAGNDFAAFTAGFASFLAAENVGNAFGVSSFAALGADRVTLFRRQSSETAGLAFIGHLGSPLEEHRLRTNSR